MPTEWQYTGQELDGGTGLVYMHARYYDPATGQFLSPDTLVPEPADVLSYNRYLYAYGNPLRFTDPTGHETSKPDWWPDWLPYPYDLPDGWTWGTFQQWLAENNIPTAVGGQAGGDAALGLFVGGQASIELQYLINFYSGEMTYAYDFVVGTRIGTPQAAIAAHGGVTFFAGATRNESIIGASEYSAVDGSLQALAEIGASVIVAQAQSYNDADDNGQFNPIRESTTGALVDPGLNRTVDSLAVNLGVGVDPVPIPGDGGVSGGLVSTREMYTVNLYEATRSFFGDLFRPISSLFQ